MQYELINPSDKIYLNSDDNEYACFSALVLGNGKYGLSCDCKDVVDMPPFILGGAEEWWKKVFNRSIAEFIDKLDKEILGKVFMSYELVYEQSSINNIVGYAQDQAKALLGEDKYNQLRISNAI